jgi:hypothetical protein
MAVQYALNTPGIAAAAVYAVPLNDQIFFNFY